MLASRRAVVPNPLKQRLFGMRREDCTFAALGYDECQDEALRRHLEGVLHVAVDAFQLAMSQPDLDLVVAELERAVDDHHRGFAFEGVGAYLAAIDLATWGATRRLDELVRGPAGHHDGLALLGAGFAVARVPWGAVLWRRYRERLDAALAWCMADGLGFHQGLFRHRQWIRQRRSPPGFLPSYDRSAFDSGIGRALWWVEGADPRRIADSIGSFPANRQGELWNGIGTACTYAAGRDGEALRDLDRRSGAWRSDFLSGVSFAPLIRRRGRNPSELTDRACRELLGMTADQAADMTQEVVTETEQSLAGSSRRSREIYDEMRRRMRERPQISTPRRTATGVPVALT